MQLKFCPVCASPLETRDIGGRQRLTCSRDENDYVFWDNPTPVVAAIVEHDGNVLLTRSKGWPEGRFGLVAGFLENGESPDEGALREVLEETGLNGVIAGFVGYYSFTLRNQIIFVFHITGEGEIVVGDELEEVKAVPPSELVPWERGTGPALRDWLARRQTA